jgi:hypothetical protein
MKRETKEYNYDWDIWTILQNAAFVSDGTPKEYKTLLSLIPHFGNALDAFIRQGEPGVLFIKLLANYLKNCLSARDEGKKSVMTSFCMATPLLYAMDLVPICLEAFTIFGTVVLKRGTSEFLDYCCEIGFTETSCSSQRGALGAFLSGLATRPDMIVCNSPGWCDSNANSYSFASAYMDIPFFQLNYPSAVSGSRSAEYHRHDYRNLIAFLQEQTGNRLDHDKLGEIIDETIRQDELINELSDLQMIVPNPIPNIYELMLYGAKSCMNGLPQMTELLESMVRHVKINASRGISGNSTNQEKARGLFCYIDHYTTDARLWDWMDAHHISHIGSILCRYWQADAPYAAGREEEAYRVKKGSLDDMIDSLADMTSRMPMVKQIRGPYDAPQMWLDDNLGLASLLKADFIVYFSTVGCRNTWGAVKLLIRDLENQGFPSLLLFLDAFDDRVMSWEAVTDKIEEFIHLRGIGA